MKRKKTLLIFDDKSESLAVSRVRRKPGSVFLILPFEYFDGTRKHSGLVAEAVRRDVQARKDRA